jgi:bacterioferritin-associated ferredoxin
MYACICKAVTVSEVHAAIDSGADSVQSVGEMTRAGTDCAGCHDHLEDILEERCRACPLAALAS